MIVDCHTHIWQSPEQLGQLVLGESGRIAWTRAARLPAEPAGPRGLPPGDADYHWSQASAVDKAIVLGFKSRYLRADIPNRYVSEYVNRYPDKLIGFAGIDPTDPAACDELRMVHAELHLRGITLSPPNQDFHPTDTRAMAVYEVAEQLGMPIVIHPLSPSAEQSKMEFGRPYLLDEVARSFPRLHIVVAQLGQPWVDETICLLAKHANVFADVSGLLRRPWQAYNTLLSCHQYGVMDKLLFGSDFPYTSATACIEAMYSLNQVAAGTNLPTEPRETLRGVVERDTLLLLGLS